jgi:hypothetical protein
MPHERLQPSEPIYNTGFGQLTFEAFYQQTHRIAGFTLRETLGMTNSDDIDDCLQAGYFNLWRRLNDDPDLFADKPKRYAVQAVVMASKAQRYAHLRHNRKLIYDAEPTQYPELPDLNPSQIDTWLDIAAALAHVTDQIDDNPPMLIALYTVITQSRVGETAQLYSMNAKTMYKHRRQVKAQLAEALPGYRPSDVPEPKIGLPKEPVVKPLLSTIYQDRTAHRFDQADRDLLTQSRRSQRIREQIRPYRTSYPTGWAGGRSLEQLIADPQVKRGAYAKLNQLGVAYYDQDDVFQQGIIRLWQKLAEEPDLLVDKGPIWTGIYIAFSGNPKSFLRRQQKQRRFTDPDFDWNTADEHLPLAGQNGHHAEWSRVIDDEIDLALKMEMLAQRYQDDLRRLLALYALTTSVYAKDVAPVAGLHPKNFAATVGNDVRRDLREVLGS